MPTLEWIGKKAVLNHHNEIPFRLLKSVPELSVGDPGSGNLLVQGDNLEALKALLPYYAGKVKCIYIDPPYNTGNEKWVYNDAVNSPEMRKWLGNVVGDDSEDLSRHDKWLCMIFPRLFLLKQFLCEEGAIFVSIDDNEFFHLKDIMDDIFGLRNFIATIVWQKRTSPESRLSLGAAHDYIVVYAKNKDKLSLNKVPLSGSRIKDYKNPDNDPRGLWASVDLTGQTGHATDDQYYDIIAPSGKIIKPPRGRCWALAERTFLDLRGDNRIWFGKQGNSKPRLKKLLIEVEGTRAWTWWPNEEVGHNQEATKELNKIIGETGTFDNPKPTRLLLRILQLATDKHAIVMDSFAGSGTTGNAVYKLNEIDGGERRFILIEMDSSICLKVTKKRLENCTRESTNRIGFNYTILGPTLFDSDGKIRREVSFMELANHVFFTETGEPLPDGESNSPLIGMSHDSAVYLLYNGILKDKSPSGGNVLTNKTLKLLPPHDGPKIIYGTACRLSPRRLNAENITFRQIPYHVKVR